MARPKSFRRLDLLEIRRQSVHARNRHSDDRIIVKRINALLCRMRRGTTTKISKSAKLSPLRSAT
ncbi:hypothetical protein CWO91_30390 [Bradyrhizobium genosp. SA-3]|uniref:hypothetical protein n=1 Tax=Bradyrhizobium genosp. SA-3 TaxID=508868 RepID=UPI001028DFC1|nr:hypothetical protein [Bradyrhizobium genosp. SA-3]RZN05383.1 hypothetical protein CWO91_30390 [Bradyrhizobium genosp. SA-3]